MKKIYIILIFFLTSCGYQPIYINKDVSKVKFGEIVFEGVLDINKIIQNSISFEENEFDDTLNDLLIKSSYEIQETSKSSKGQVESYRSQIIVDLVISNKSDVVSRKVISKNFSYPTKENKYELVRYQKEIKNNLINDVVQDLILFINIQ